jgi:hypothetical protein
MEVATLTTPQKINRGVAAPKQAVPAPPMPMSDEAWRERAREVARKAASHKGIADSAALDEREAAEATIKELQDKFLSSV